MAYYSKRHYQRLSNGGPDSPAAVAERIAYRKAAEQAHAETLARFGQITTQNFQEAAAWQAARIKEILGR